MELEPASANEIAIADIQQKIGRNVLLSQQLEHMLKYLLANESIAGKASEIEQLRHAKVAEINKRSLGRLVGGIFESALSQVDSEFDEPEELDEAYFSFRFQVATDAQYIDKKKQSLAAVVADRNELVHHFLARFQIQLPESRAEAVHFLDQQADKLRSEIADLKTLIDRMEEARTALVEYLDSEIGKKELELSWLRHSRLVLLLGDIANQVARPDGWVSMNVAGQLLKLHAAEDVGQMKERYGHKTLKSLVVATELFDLLEEATQKGGTRLLYRIKPGWELNYA